MIEKFWKWFFKPMRVVAISGDTVTVKGKRIKIPYDTGRLEPEDKELLEQANIDVYIRPKTYGRSWPFFPGLFY